MTQKPLARNPLLLGAYYLLASQVGVVIGHKILYERGNDAPEALGVALAAAALSFVGTWLMVYGTLGGEL